MNEVLKEIFSTNTVKDESGKSIPVHSHTGEEQGLFLQNLVKKIKPTSSVEVGLAYGISSLFILESLKELGNADKSHVIFEPYPDEYWNNIGLLNIQRAGLEHLADFRKTFSSDGLIDLIKQNRSIQFAYIDSTKVFDILMADFFLINKILDIGGVIVFDDCAFPGIRKLVRYISKIPSYTIYDTFSKDEESSKRRTLKNLVSKAMIQFPKPKIFFEGIDFKTDEQNKINFHCIAFKKISEDERSWDWAVDF